MVEIKKYFIGLVIAFFIVCSIYVYVTEQLSLALKVISPTKLNLTLGVERSITHLTASKKKELPICKTPVRNCTGKTTDDWFKVSEDVAYLDKLNRHSDVEMGGTWKPKDCQPKEMIAIILPFRDREAHLQLFTRNMIPFLKAQNKAFTIFVLDQKGPALFSRAGLMNAGFIESQKLGNYTCIIFHDVDMLPVHLCNEYECPATGMRHLGLSRDIKFPRYVYLAGVGGAAAFPKKVFEQINGFTNIMFGWGGEDDEGYARLRRMKIQIHRYSAYIGNYLAVTAKKGDSTNPHSGRSVGECQGHAQYMKYDGLNTVNYKIEKIDKDPLYTRIMVHLPGPSSVGAARLFLNQQTNMQRELLKKGAPPPGVSTSATQPTTRNPKSITNTTFTKTFTKAPKAKLNSTTLKLSVPLKHTTLAQPVIKNSSTTIKPTNSNTTVKIKKPNVTIRPTILLNSIITKASTTRKIISEKTST